MGDPVEDESSRGVSCLRARIQQTRGPSPASLLQSPELLVSEF